MRTLIAIAALVASVSANAGELDGKSLIYDFDWGGDPVFFMFDEGAVVRCDITVEGTTASEACRDQSQYETYIDTIVWRYVGASYTLNRQSLELVLINERTTNGAVLGNAECSLPKSLEAWRDSKSAKVKSRQQAINEQMKNNKI